MSLDLELEILVTYYDPDDPIRVPFAADAELTARLGQRPPAELLGHYVAISAGPTCHAGRARIVDAHRADTGELVIDLELGPDSDPALWDWLRHRFARWR